MSISVSLLTRPPPNPPPNTPLPSLPISSTDSTHSNSTNDFSPININVPSSISSLISSSTSSLISSSTSSPLISHSIPSSTPLITSSRRLLQPAPPRRTASHSLAASFPCPPRPTLLKFPLPPSSSPSSAIPSPSCPLTLQELTLSNSLSTPPPPPPLSNSSTSYPATPLPPASNPRECSPKGNVIVSVRIRSDLPATSVCPTEFSPPGWLIDRNSSSITYSLPRSTHFTYDNVFTPFDDNSSVYNAAAKRLVRRVMEGYHGTIFAYGMTGSGKTFSMQGTATSPGVIPLAITDIFAFVRETPHREFLLRVSYLEIYNEKIYDLLSSRHSSSGAHEEIKLREDPRRGVYAVPLKEEIVKSPTQLLRVIARGDTARRTATTQFNARSSRSHAVVQIVVESRERISTQDSLKRTSTSPGGVRVSTLSLIDLAGSERAAECKERRTEGGYINKSLLTLGTIISRLSSDKNDSNSTTEENHHPNSTITTPSSGPSSSTTHHIPYRGSKLTRLLQPALSGNSLVSILCTIYIPWGGGGGGATCGNQGGPGGNYVYEALNTLKFANRAKNNIVSHAKRSEEGLGGNSGSRALLERYRMEIIELRRQLKEQKELSDNAIAAAATANAAANIGQTWSRRVSNVGGRERSSSSSLHDVVTRNSSLEGGGGGSTSSVITGEKLRGCEEEEEARQRHEGHMLEIQIARTALKERIEHLNRLILSSKSQGVNSDLKLSTALFPMTSSSSPSSVNGPLRVGSPNLYSLSAASTPYRASDSIISRTGLTSGRSSLLYSGKSCDGSLISPISCSNMSSSSGRLRKSNSFVQCRRCTSGSVGSKRVRSGSSFVQIYGNRELFHTSCNNGVCGTKGVSNCWQICGGNTLSNAPSQSSVGAGNSGQSIEIRPSSSLSNLTNLSATSSTDSYEQDEGGGLSLLSRIRTLQSDLADRNRYIRSLEQCLIETRQVGSEVMYGHAKGLTSASGSTTNGDNKSCTTDKSGVGSSGGGNIGGGQSTMDRVGEPICIICRYGIGKGSEGIEALIRDKNTEIRELKARLEDMEKMCVALRNATRRGVGSSLSGGNVANCHNGGMNSAVSPVRGFWMNEEVANCKTDTATNFDTSRVTKSLIAVAAATASTVTIANANSATTVTSGTELASSGGGDKKHSSYCSSIPIRVPLNISGNRLRRVKTSTSSLNDDLRVWTPETGEVSSGKGRNVSGANSIGFGIGVGLTARSGREFTARKQPTTRISSGLSLAGNSSAAPVSLDISGSSSTSGLATLAGLNMTLGTAGPSPRISIGSSILPTNLSTGVPVPKGGGGTGKNNRRRSVDEMTRLMDLKLIQRNSSSLAVNLSLGRSGDGDGDGETISNGRSANGGGGGDDNLCGTNGGGNRDNDQGGHPTRVDTHQQQQQRQHQQQNQHQLIFRDPKDPGANGESCISSPASSIRRSESGTSSLLSPSSAYLDNVAAKIRSSSEIGGTEALELPESNTPKMEKNDCTLKSVVFG